MREHPDPVYLYRLKDQVRDRCYNLCEYCLLRWGEQLHHRHYETWGRERPCDVMLVCDRCHRAIEGLDSPRDLCVDPHSLAALGDDGRGDFPLWRAWLRQCEEFTAAVIRARQNAAWQCELERLARVWDAKIGQGFWPAAT